MRDWDLVLRGGRVIDPESGLDAVRDIAVAAGRIAAIGAALPPALVDLDLAGQVLTSGFIDLHSHVSDLGGLRLQAMDGVTTALELEAGVTPVAEAYRRAAAPPRSGVAVFDPETITYRDSTRPSAGIRHVLVNGTFVVRDGEIAADARPGRPIRADPR